VNAARHAGYCFLLLTPRFVSTHQLVKVVSPSLPSLILTSRQLCDIEMLLTGGFSPLNGFMNKAQYEGVVENMRLPSGHVWPMPITLDVSHETATEYEVGTQVGLRDQFFNLIAVLTVTEVYIPDKANEALKVLRTTDTSHPAVDYLFNQAGEVYVGGTLEGVRLPQHFDFNELRFTPAEARAKFKEMGWGRFVAFQTRNPMHRAHIELTRRASREIKGRVFINPVVGMTKPGDVDYATRVRCYQQILKNADRYYGKNGVFLGLLPLAMRMAGPREALWHSIIRKNHGASHFVVGRDHAGCKSADGEDFYGPYDAQELVMQFADEIGITMVPFKMLVYVPGTDTYHPFDEVPDGTMTLKLSGTKFRAMMANGDDIPDWFSDPDVIRILRQVKPPKPRRGFTVFFTGLSGSGKTTIAAALVERLTAANPARPITVLDGDVVRTHLSKGLGFSVHDRNTNVARIGWVAAEIARHRGISITCAIAPFEFSRAAARQAAAQTGGGFMVVHVATPLNRCKTRDVKGLYKRAEAGEIKMTGDRHPYEFPEEAELTFNTEGTPVETSVDLILGFLTREGYLEEQESLAVLRQHPEVVTAGVKDPAHLQCANLARPTAVMVAGALESSLTGLRTNLNLLGAHAFSFTGETLATAETPDRETATASVVSVTLNADGTVSGGDLAAVDGSISTGTPATSPLNADDIVESAWWLYESIRDNDELYEKTVAISHPRLIVYAATILRFDPCLKMLLVKDSADAIVAELTAAGTDATAAARYAEDYLTTVDHLAASHPNRVMVVDAATITTSRNVQAAAFVGLA